MLQIEPEQAGRDRSKIGCTAIKDLQIDNFESAGRRFESPGALVGGRQGRREPSTVAAVQCNRSRMFGVTEHAGRSRLSC
jgi:hypothetical protein